MQSQHAKIEIGDQMYTRFLDMPMLLYLHILSFALQIVTLILHLR